MDEPRDDAFERACRRLEQLSELKDKQRIDEANFENLKEALIAEMRRSIVPLQQTPQERPSQRVAADADHPVQFGYLYGEVVRVLNGRYRSSPEDARQRIFRSMSDMADSRALYPGDSAELEKLVDGVFASYEQSTDANPDDELRILVRTLADLNRISMKVRDNPERSPAAKAITEVTQQSANQVAVEFEAQVPQPGGPKKPLRELWGASC